MHEHKKGEPNQPGGWEGRRGFLPVRVPYMVPRPACWARRSVIWYKTACFAMLRGTWETIGHETLTALCRRSIEGRMGIRYRCVIRHGEQSITVIIRHTVEGFGGTVPFSFFSLQRVKRTRQGQRGGELVHLLINQMPGGPASYSKAKKRRHKNVGRYQYCDWAKCSNKQTKKPREPIV